MSPLGLHASAQQGEAVRQLPALQGLGRVKGAGLALKERQVVDRVEGHALFAPMTGVSGNELVGCGDGDLVDPAKNRQPMVGKRRRD